MQTDFYKKTISVDANAAYLGISVEELMEKAGKGIAEQLIKKYGKENSFSFVCGLGNNGGDGFVTARYLHESGVKEIKVYLVGRITDISSKSASVNFEKLKDTGIHVKTDVTSTNIEQSDISIECLLGTGIKGSLHKRFKDVIVRLTKQKTKIVAIDAPVPGYSPDFVISLLYPKTNDSDDKQVVIDIGIPKEAELYTGPGDVKVLEVPDFDSYKSQNGELFVYAGSQQFHGAAIMTVKAASKLIGSIFFYTNPENRELVNGMKMGLEEFIAIEDNQVERFAEYSNAFLFGPGLEVNLPTQAIVGELLRRYPDKPAILDAYAISVAKDKGLLKDKILTPHRGELRHIFGEESGYKKLSAEGIKGKLRRFAIENECYIILKGHIDILFHKNGDIALNRTGNAGMAKGGTGDVLAGILGAFITKNDIWTSMRAACFVNGIAGDNLYKQVGFNYSATDIIPEIQKVIQWCKNF